MTSSKFQPSAAPVERFKYICAHDLVVETSFHRRLLELWDAVRVETDGRLEVETIPFGQAGPSPVMLEKLISNGIQFHPISGMPLTNVVPLAAMEGLPYAFRSESEARSIFHGKLGEYIRAEIAKIGIVAFPELWPQGFNQVTSTRHPIRDVEDFEGLRVRVAKSPYLVDLYESLGASPQQINLQEIRPSLSDGRADGTELTFIAVEYHKIYEVNKYLNLADTRFASFWMCANGDAWKSLPEDIQAIVTRNNTKFAALYTADRESDNLAAAERLKTHGITFTQTDIGSIKKRLTQSGFYKRWRAEFGEHAWGLLEAERGPLC